MDFGAVVLAKVHFICIVHLFFIPLHELWRAFAEEKWSELKKWHYDN